MIEIASQIILCLVVSSIIGFSIGFLVGKASKGDSTAKHTINPIFTKQGNVYNKPFVLGSPRPCGKDDFTVIKDIDKETEESLNSLGIFHYDQISKWTQNNCEWVEEHLSLGDKITQESWVDQAKKLSIKRL